MTTGWRLGTSASVLPQIRLMGPCPVCLPPKIVTLSFRGVSIIRIILRWEVEVYDGILQTQLRKSSESFAARSAQPARFGVVELATPCPLDWHAQVNCHLGDL